uniref:Uncharacterized protein n=1 Tax=Romanomermis culicivorax TaxID=13658 RepID=A0A915JNV9_ROMCU
MNDYVPAGCNIYSYQTSKIEFIKFLLEENRRQGERRQKKEKAKKREPWSCILHWFVKKENFIWPAAPKFK